ncbi:hypothetical protein M3Y99_00485000 [Aphelenchoides fujianensis]|nr:hypothetical protein M3Y99_00485000 [Aphelenchoides fujianensis]
MAADGRKRAATEDDVEAKRPKWEDAGVSVEEPAATGEFVASSSEPLPASWPPTSFAQVPSDDRCRWISVDSREFTLDEKPAACWSSSAFGRSRPLAAVNSFAVHVRIVQQPVSCFQPNTHEREHGAEAMEIDAAS